MPKSAQYGWNCTFSCISRKGTSFLVDSDQRGLQFKVILTCLAQRLVTSSLVQCRWGPRYGTEEWKRTKTQTTNCRQNLKILNQSLRDGKENACLMGRLTSAKKAMIHFRQKRPNLLPCNSALLLSAQCFFQRTKGISYWFVCWTHLKDWYESRFNLLSAGRFSCR